jgi:hypothetical protein
MMRDEITIKFDELIKRVVTCIEQNNIQKARNIFNRNVFPEFKEIVWKTSSPLNKFVFFFCELDEYLNNKGARIANAINKEKVLDDYYGDYSNKLSKI